MNLLGTTRAGKSCIGRTFLMQYLSQQNALWETNAQEKLESALLPACVIVLPAYDSADEQQSETPSE